MRDNELLIYGLLFLAIVGFNLFKQFLAARAQQRLRQQQAAAAQGMPQPLPEQDPEPFALSESDWGRAPGPTSASDAALETPVEDRPVMTRTPPSSATYRAAPPVSRAQNNVAVPRVSSPSRSDSRIARRRARHHLFQSRSAQRDGIVMMTVLGPCRALQPYGQEQS